MTGGEIRCPTMELRQLVSITDVSARMKDAIAGLSGAALRTRFDAERASVGLQALPVDHPLCGGGGTDNRVAIYSDRYPEHPLVVQGPGAGAEVTAAALLDDVLGIARR